MRACVRVLFVNHNLVVTSYPGGDTKRPKKRKKEEGQLNETTVNSNLKV